MYIWSAQNVRPIRASVWRHRSMPLPISRSQQNTTLPIGRDAGCTRLFQPRSVDDHTGRLRTSGSGGLRGGQVSKARPLCMRECAHENNNLSFNMLQHTRIHNPDRRTTLSPRSQNLAGGEHPTKTRAGGRDKQHESRPPRNQYYTTVHVNALHRQCTWFLLFI